MTVRTIDDIFRDFVIDGVPASGPFNPFKPDIRDTLKALLEGLSAFPDNRVIRLNNADEGTANNIVVSASVAIPAAAYQVLYILNVTKENTGPVAVSGAINRTLVTNTNRPIETGYLKPGMALLCIDTGTELRLLSYGDAEAIQQAAEEAADRAETAAEQAQEAASNAVSQGNVPIYSTRNAVEGLELPGGLSAFRTNGFSTVGDGLPALWVESDTGAEVWDLRNKVTDANGETFWLKKQYRETISQRGQFELGTIIWFGSSTFAGQGTSGYVEQPSVDNGWANSPTSFPAMVAAKYGSRARVINCSVGGSNTLSLQLEFFNKVEPQSPRFVILGSGWVNEYTLAGSNVRAAASNYVARLRRLVGLCRKYGAKPIVAAFTPVDGYSEDFRYAQLDVMRAIDMMGVPRWDMLGIAGTGDLNFKAGRAADNVHGNDVAHLAYFDSARWSDIEIGSMPLWRDRGGTGVAGKLVISTTADVITEPPLATVFDTASASGQVDFPKSLTVMAKLTPPAALASQLQNLISIHRGSGYENEPLRVRINTSNQYQLVRNDGAGTIVMHTSTLAVGTTERTHTLVYDHSSNRVRWYIEGTLQFEANNVPMSSDIYAVTVGGDATNTPRARGWSIGEYKLWKVPLQGLRFIGPVLRGEVYAGSMLFDMDFTVENAFSGINRLNTFTRASIGTGVTFTR